MTVPAYLLRTLLIGVIFIALAVPVRAQTSASEIRLDERFASAALGRDLAYSLYLPPGHDAPGRRFPTLYLLHGVDGNHREWLDEGRLRESLDRLIGKGAVAPMIVVMPDGDNSWYVDSQALGGPGDYASAIGQDLVAHVEATLPAYADARHRGVGGLSMGGIGALRFAFRQPFRFAAAASFSGAFWARLAPETKLGDFAEHIFKGSFGRPFEAKRFLAESPLTLVEGLAGVKDPPPVFLTVGDADRYKLYDDSFRLFRRMRELGLPVEMRMTAGDHDWDTWAAELPDALRFFDRVFKRGDALAVAHGGQP